MKVFSRTRAVKLALLVLAASMAAPSPGNEPDNPPDGMPFKHGLGHELFQESCARCHGPDLRGTDQGPPLVHGYYVPSHHGDAAFYRAIEQGSPQHHWTFGDMPPVDGVDDGEARAIVDFVRWYQQDAGLY